MRLDFNVLDPLVARLLRIDGTKQRSELFELDFAVMVCVDFLDEVIHVLGLVPLDEQCEQVAHLSHIERNQRPSETISGHQRPSVGHFGDALLRRIQTHSGTLKRTLRRACSSSSGASAGTPPRCSSRHTSQRSLSCIFVRNSTLTMSKTASCE